MQEILRLNTKQELEKVKILILDDDWNLQVIHSKGVSIFNMRNNRSKIIFPKFEDNCSILRNSMDNILLSFDFSYFIEINSKSHYIKHSVKLSEKYNPLFYMENSFVICRFNRYLDVEDRLFLNIGLYDEEDEDNTSMNAPLKATNITSFMILIIDDLDENGQPHSKLLYQTEEKISCCKLINLSLLKDGKDYNKDLILFDFYIILQSFKIEKISFKMFSEGLGSIEVPSVNTFTAFPNQIISFISEAQIRGEITEKNLVDTNLYQNKEFSIEKMMKEESNNVTTIANNSKNPYVTTEEIALKTNNPWETLTNFTTELDFKYSIDDIILEEPFDSIVVVIRTESDKVMKSFVSYVNLENHRGFSLMLPFLKNKKINDLDQFNFKVMKNSPEFEFVVYGKLGVVALKLTSDQKLEILGYRNVKFSKTLFVEFSKKSERFFVMSDQTIDIWNKNFTIKFHHFESKTGFKYIQLNEESQSLAIYSKKR